jgi:RNA recognition motif-containing protein
MSTTVKVFCGNLPFTMSQDELKNSFAAHGKVV